VLTEELMKSFILTTSLSLNKREVGVSSKSNVIMEKVLKYESDIAKDISEIRKYLKK